MQTAVFFTVIILLTASAVANEVNMTVEHSGGKKCGENVTLLCRLSSESKVVLEFSWVLNLAENSTKVLCNSSKPEKRESNRIHCKYQRNQYLALTITHPQQSDNGLYFCKAQTSIGHNSKMISVNITDCANQRSPRINGPRPNNACASERKWINLLVSLTALLSLILDSSM
ncbi:hypothetical protein PHYPO_G00109810 [Pangasianodon hypophthalmus]|uniref:Ig-like domain-containing protein n=1 Tax=Pangasianodon hypophthalmus TaxID=310915 RepID=A0A5N5PYA8_PANHP|nr:hypothetical protein PHYPO_G00109810 [Pangasianodon hypophthalmus]